jgi:hypothetical protein
MTPSLRHQPEGLRTPLKGAGERSIIIFSKGFMNGKRDIEGGASPQRGLAPPKKQGYPGKGFERKLPLIKRDVLAAPPSRGGAA